MNIAVPANISAANARLPQVYEDAKTALANCVRIDECQSWADKAAALASYAKQANDEELMRQATRIRDRAIRRCGELLKQIEAETPRDYPTAEALASAYQDYAQNHRVFRAPEVSGVYAFWSPEGRCMYVGESRCLQNRIQSHPRKRELPGCSIRWLACNNHKQAEIWLIEAFHPLCNGITEDHAKRVAAANARHAQTPLDDRMNDVWLMLFDESISDAVARTNMDAA
jgi:hypothetical protein